MSRVPSLSAAFCLVILATTCVGQVMIVNPANAPVGATLSLDVFNNTANPVGIPLIGVPYRVFNEHGTLVWGQGHHTDAIFIVNVAPGATESAPFDTTLAPGLPLAAGHYYAEVNTTPETAMSKFTLGSPSGSAPDFVFRMSDGTDAHEPSWPGATLRLTNASTAALTHPGATWTATIGTNTSSTVTGSIPSVTLNAGKSVDFAWPSNLFLIHPLTVRMEITWNDPTAGNHTQVLEVSGTPWAAHETCRTFLPHGSTVPSGSALPVVVQSYFQAPCLCPAYPYAPSDAYALLFSLSSGNTPLPAGTSYVPLANDALLQASLAGAFTALTPGSPGIATGAGGLPQAGPIGLVYLVHPAPSVSGASVQMACVAWATSLANPLSQPWQTSIARTITFE